MDREEVNARIKLYNQNISYIKCSLLERKYIDQTSRKYFFGFGIDNIKMFDTVDEFLKYYHYFKNLLPEHYDKLDAYLQHIQEYTCNSDLIRMDVRSHHFSYYQRKVINAIGGFYVFYAAGFNMKDLIYGEYRQLYNFIDFAPVIAIELLENNQEVIQYCQDVLTSENNTAVLTRDVIKAIQQSHHQGLQDLLTQVFLAAKLQEGLRQSIIETVDEHQLDYFIKIIDVIKEHQLLRYSSIQRGVLTWIGIGYEIVDKKSIEYIFNILYDYLHDENQRQSGLIHQNPLNVYLALYCQGIHEVDKAIQEASKMMQYAPHIVASTLIYLKLTKNFPILLYRHLLDQYQNNEMIMALYFSECTHYDFTKLSLTQEECHFFFNHLIHFMKTMKNQSTYSSKGFEWFQITLNKVTLALSLYQLVQCYHEPSLIEQFLPYVASSLSYERLDDFMKYDFPLLSIDIQKPFMLKEIISTNQRLVRCISKNYKKMSLNEEDILALEERLKTKKDFSRAQIIQILSQQSKNNVLNSYQRLFASSNKLIHESALELQQIAPQYFHQIGIPKKVILGREQGFGLYRPYQNYVLPYSSHLQYKKSGFLKNKEHVDLSFLQVYTKQQILDYIDLWIQRLLDHSQDEYEIFGEYHQLQDDMFSPAYNQEGLDSLPLSKIWQEYFEEDQLSIDEIFQLTFFNYTYDSSDGVLLDKFLPNDLHLIVLNKKDTKKYPQLQFCQYKKIIKCYFNKFAKTKAYQDKACAILEIFNHYASPKKYKKIFFGNYNVCSLSSIELFYFLEGCLNLNELNDHDFKEYFPIVYECYHEFHLKLSSSVVAKFNISPLILSRAVILGLIPQTVLLEAIMDNHTKVKESDMYYDGKDLLYYAYNEAYFNKRGTYGHPCFDLPDKMPDPCLHLRNTLDAIADTLLCMEATRLNEVTEVTSYVQELKVIRGVKYLIIALHVLENEDMKRQTSGNERSVVFTNVIRNCYPLDNDSPQTLIDENFSSKRLVEVAMIAPQWIRFIAQVLQWDGFLEACYYFIAHMKQYDYDHKKAEIAKFTDLDPQDLNDGAFDHKWCQEVYQKLGDKRMKILYSSAKFLCDNSFHVRARKYADAALAKESKETYLKRVQEKRNKDDLNAYCICPLVDEKDLLERYMYVQKFLKESLKFGAQRRNSEKRAGEIALMNLARNSHYETVTRLSWMMESQIVQQNSDYLHSRKIEDIEIYIEIDEHGKNQICVIKNGKKMKSIPARLKKHQQIIEIKNIHNQWNEQYRRARKMLEQAMEDRTEFAFIEIQTIMQNPIVAPMLSKLVLMNQNHFGYYHKGQLQGINETYDFTDSIYIAHPYDLYHNQCWHDYQEFIFNQHIIQPFKQVFRELYLKLDDELEECETKRYTGYQIQPQKAAATLKSRRWNVSYENGLERIYYKNNLIVNLYADADWFSPSDIEAPSIDYVAFSSRQDNHSIFIKDVDAVVFSETMRDIDLAVSTAYVGGVDPITSSSTIDLRKTIIEYTCRLMKLNNVIVKDHFANISGSYNDYSVHLGSGVIHQTGGASLNVIPVYSGQRGKVYLPFLDEDPLTALILSKVIMLAEDRKIKDPALLKQIVFRKT